MAETADYLHEPRAAGDRNGPTPAEIRGQLRSIFESPVFHGSKRCKQFLDFICEKSLAGEADTLKERTIAVEVFGRPPQSDLGEDTIVRVGAREVRKRLAQYYVTPDGLAAEVHIDLLPGSYAPEFRYAIAPREEATKERIPSPAAVVMLRETADRARRTRTAGVGALVLLVLVSSIAAIQWTRKNAPDEGFRRFWEPILATPDPLLLAVANPLVYHPSARAMRLSLENRPAEKVTTQVPIDVPANKLDGSDLIPVSNQYVGYGDMVVAAEVAGILGRKAKPFRVRLASGVQFADLRQGQTLLIGSITNRWTMELSQAWRFQFAQIPGLETVIVDTQTQRRWRVPSHQDGSTPEDYMLICRIRSSITGGLVMVAAGVKQFGTEAAGRLLSDAGQLSAVLAKLPKGWEEKNLQIVLHSRVIGNTPGQPDVEAWHVW